MQNDNHKNTKPALIFDFGGVLLEWNPRNLFLKLFNGDADAVEKFLTEIDFFGWNIEQDRGERSFAEGIELLVSQHPQYASQIRAYDARWEESISGPIHSTVDALLKLKDLGYDLYGLTNWSMEKFPAMYNRYSFFKTFKTIVVSGEVKLAKPDPAIFLMMLGHIGRPAGQCVMIDDSAANIESAKQLGLQTIHFSSAGQMLTELAQLEAKAL